jgi:spore maturation protein CgeB
MRILLLNPNYIARHNWGHQLFKNEFAKHHDVTYYGNGYPDFNKSLSVKNILTELNKKFDIILIYESKYSKNFNGLGEITDIPKVLIQIDYAIGIPNYKGFAKTKTINKLIRKNKPDLIFATSTSNVSAMKSSLDMDKVFFLPFSVDTNIYENMNLKRTNDVMAVFTIHSHAYPNRKKIQDYIRRMKVKSFTTKVVQRQYIRKINESKIFVISNNINNRLSMKYTEAMACGTLVLADKPEDLELQGFKENEHLVIYSGVSELKDKIKYYLKNKDERNRIAKNGMLFVRENHSCEKRVEQFITIVKRELKI